MSLVGVSMETFDSNMFARSVQRMLRGRELYMSVYAVFVEDGSTV